jgi:hypothetical protein
MANYNAILSVDFTNVSGAEPVSLNDAKLYCKVDDLINYDDNLIIQLITAAREVIEAYTNEALTTRTVTAIMCNSCGNVYLPYSPVTSSVTLSDSSGEVLGGKNGYIKTPITDYITATYTAGYTSATLPKKYAEAIKMQIAYMYENRGDLQVAPTVKSILSNARKLF